MPELPEVETVKNTLKLKILNKQIDNVLVNYSNIIEYPTSEEFITKLKGQVINDIKRRGKWLIYELDNYYLLSHLRMEGKYVIKTPNEEITKHQHVIFKFNDDTDLRYVDTRKFGKMYLFDKMDNIYSKKPLNEVGLEPWDENLTVSYLKEAYKNKKLPIKTGILDQSIIAGIGNIYADEILYLSNINPLEKCLNLTDKQLNNIINNTRIVLTKAIEEGGTTIISYESSEGVHGRFQQSLNVHRKEGEPCPNCKSIILKTRVGGRGTYYCPNCQK